MLSAKYLLDAPKQKNDILIVKKEQHIATGADSTAEIGACNKEIKQGSMVNGRLLSYVLLMLGTGGSGKTFLARLLAEYLLGKMAGRLRLIDADEPSKADLARLFDVAQVLRLVDRTDITKLFEVIRGAGAGITLVDVKADRQTEFRSTATLSPQSVRLLKREGVQVIAFLPLIAAKAGSMSVVADWHQLLGPDAQYVLVANEVSGQIDFDRLPEHLDRFVRDVHPSILHLPKLEEEIAGELDRRNVRMLHLLRAAGYDGPGALPLLEGEDPVDDYGPSLSSPFNLPVVEDFWKQFHAEAEKVLVPLLGLES